MAFRSRVRQPDSDSGLFEIGNSVFHPDQRFPKHLAGTVSKGGLSEKRKNPFGKTPENNLLPLLDDYSHLQEADKNPVRFFPNPDSGHRDSLVGHLHFGNS